MRSVVCYLAGLAFALSLSEAIARTPPLDFELASADGFVRLSALPPQPTLINFWRSDCPPCVREMPVLAELARTGTLRVLAIAVQRPSETLSAPEPVRQALQPPMRVLYAPAEPRALLSRFGDPHQALPHTVLLNADRSVCAMHGGEIDRAWVEVALRRCHNALSDSRGTKP